MRIRTIAVSILGLAILTGTVLALVFDDPVYSVSSIAVTVFICFLAAWISQESK